MIRHVFMFKIAADASARTIVDILNELPGKVPGIEFWQIGEHSGEPGESGDVWDYVLISDFVSWEALEKYSDHPYHQEVVAKLLPMFADRAVCDFEFTAEGASS